MNLHGTGSMKFLAHGLVDMKNLIHGLARYEVAINETEPKYLCQSLSVESFDTGNIIR